MNRYPALRAIRPLGAALLLLVALGCAGPRVKPQPEIPPMHSIAEFKDQDFAYVADPWEKFNLNMYRFNFYFDKYLFLPVVHGYEFVTPVVVQNRVSHFFSNLAEIRNLTNSVMQAKGVESLATLGRFLTNSTIGIGGLFDPATPMGLPRHPEDFGKTLGHWGAGPGPYLVLPIFGPSSLRDGTGLAADAGIFYGIYSAIGPFDHTGHSFAISSGITVLDAIDLRHRQSFRYFESGFPFEYYMVRFFYHEKRELEAGAASGTPAAPGIPLPVSSSQPEQETAPACFPRYNVAVALSGGEAPPSPMQGP